MGQFEGYTPHGDEDAPDALDVEDAFGEHEIEYWVPRDGRLAPATPEQVARIREHEALERLTYWQRLETRRQPSPTRSSRARRANIGGVVARLVALFTHTPRPEAAAPIAPAEAATSEAPPARDAHPEGSR